jgi:hypothetical protein
MTTTAFVSYCHADEKALERLRKHLALLQREGTLPTWTDHAIVPGDRLDSVISDQLERSQVFLALLSPDYLASRYCYDTEFKRALELAAAGRMRIVPIIVEPCDWLSSPFKDFSALPKDGQPISGFTNANLAYLNVVTGLRRMIEAMAPGALPLDPDPAPESIRKPRVKQDFDTIQRAEYADRAFAVIRDYFRASCAEVAQIGDDLRARFEDMDPTAFTCSVVNRAKRSGGEAHITVHNTKSRSHGFGGDISYVNQRHAERNTSNGSIRVSNDDYQMFLTMDRYGMSSGREEGRISPEQASERLWTDFVKQAGVEYD